MDLFTLFPCTLLSCWSKAGLVPGVTLRVSGAAPLFEAKAPAVKTATPMKASMTSRPSKRALIIGRRPLSARSIFSEVKGLFIIWAFFLFNLALKQTRALAVWCSYQTWVGVESYTSLDESLFLRNDEKKPALEAGPETSEQRCTGAFDRIPLTMMQNRKTSLAIYNCKGLDVYARAVG